MNTNEMMEQYNDIRELYLDSCVSFVYISWFLEDNVVLDDWYCAVIQSTFECHPKLKKLYEGSVNKIRTRKVLL